MYFKIIHILISKFTQFEKKQVKTLFRKTSKLLTRNFWKIADNKTTKNPLFCSRLKKESCPSGLRSTLGKRVYRKVSRVRISHSPPI